MYPIIFSPRILFKQIRSSLIDFLIIEFLFVAPFGGILSKVVPKNAFTAVNTISRADLQTLTLVMLLITVLILAYFLISEYKLGQSLGKFILNIHIISEKPIRLWQIFVSNLLMIPFFPFVLLWLVDPIYAVFSKENQRLLEKWAKLKVVELHML